MIQFALPWCSPRPTLISFFFAGHKETHIGAFVSEPFFLPHFSHLRVDTHFGELLLIF